MTSSEVSSLLSLSDRMVRGHHFASSSLREQSWGLRELHDSFVARAEERERTLHEAAAFFRAAEKVRVWECEGVRCEGVRVRV